MTQSSFFLTNGSSLEDCHTNFFALADLCGIKWRQYSCDKNFSDINDDPVLSSFVKCINAELLCVWRRVRTNNTQDQSHLYINYSKELWIFWYGDEPDLKELVSCNLKEGEQGSWESGLSYECRTLLFKALHNLIERCLLSKGYARIGQWFFQVKTQDKSDALKEGTEITFTFNFFLHGDSNVCANVDVRQHTAIRPVSKDDISAAQQLHGGVRVILSPYGLQGYLTGIVYKENNQIAQKFLSEWNKIYPLPKFQNENYSSSFSNANDDHSDNSNKVLEVIVGDYKMKYPISYVFITESDAKFAKLKLNRQNEKTDGDLYDVLAQINKKSDECLENIKLIMSPYNNHLPSDIYFLKNDTNQIINFCDVSFLEKIDSIKSENFDIKLNEMILKKPCNCPKCIQNCNIKRYIKSTSSALHKNKDKFLEKEKAKHLKNHFHHRSSMNLLQTISSLPLSFSLPQTNIDSFNSTVKVNENNNNQASVTPLIMSYKSPVSTSTSSILNTPGVESSPMSNFNIESNENISPPTSKDENVIHTPTNSCPNNTSPKAKSNYESSNFPGTCDSIHNPENPELNILDNQLNLNSTSSKTLDSDKKNLKRLFRYKSLYEDENSLKLRTGLLYDFSLEKGFWETHAPKNRRRMKNKDFESSIESTFNYLENHRDPYEFKDFEEIDYNHVNNEVANYDGKDFSFSNGLPEIISSKQTETTDSNITKSKINNGNKISFNGETHYDLGFLHSPAEESIESASNIKSINSFSTNTETETMISSKNNSNILNSTELIRMFPTPPSMEAMVSSPSNPIIISEAKAEKQESNQIEMEKLETNSFFDVDLKNTSVVYMPPIQSVFITSNKYAPLDNVECKSSLPSNYYYKHNVRKQSMKLFFSNSQILSKPKSFSHLSQNKMNLHSLMKSPRTINANIPMNSFNLQSISRSRPIINMPQSMYYMSENHTTFKQNSPSFIDSPLPSSMNNFINNSVQSLDNRKSPFLFSQNINSPNTVVSSSTLNNYNPVQAKIMPQNLYNSHSHFDQNSISPMISEADSLMLNLLLSDSMFNLFRDHNFESCSMCVCNMNIKGNDVGIYLPEYSHSNSDYYPCTCGFSAITNRQLSQFSGLFYEDEVEITGIFYDPAELTKAASNQLKEHKIFDKDITKYLHEIDENLINLILTESTTIFPSTSTLAKLMYCNRTRVSNLMMNDGQNQKIEPPKLIFKDFANVTLISLHMARYDSNNSKSMLMPSHNISYNSKRSVLHDWPFRNSNSSVNNYEVILTLKTLQPLMQESIQRKVSLSEITYNSVKGPLTWRQFHRLAGRGTEYQCEPQPIPSLLVGYDKDCVALSPYGLKFWEKLSLEPYAVTRDIHYIVICPNNEYILSSVKCFFKELSTTYEILRLGKHIPMIKLSSDGIYPINNSNNKTENSVLDDWFNQLGDSSLANKIRYFAQGCFDLLTNLSIYDRKIFESKQKDFYNPSNNNNANNMLNGNLSNSCISMSHTIPQHSLSNYNHVNNSTNENSSDHLINELDPHNTNQEHIPSHSVNPLFQPYDEEENANKNPTIVIYVIETFSSYGKEVTKLGCTGLLKIFSLMSKHFSENMKNNIHMQILSLSSIMCNDKDFRKISRQSQLKELSFAVYSQCKQQLLMQPNIKSLTGFGPAASFEFFLKNKDPFHNKTQLFTTPYILAPLKDKQTELGEMFGDRREKSQILYCSYCLTEDQKWLLASCTNDKGDILQTKVININIPNRNRRKTALVRRFGLEKLMQFIQASMSESVLPWRLVIGRLGRIGHGELKDWTFLLSKKALLKYSRQLRETCDQCHHLASHDQPAIYSACLISLEADTALRVFPDYYTPDERFSSSCNTCSLSTPEDSSCTHILVFPTSATTQSSHANLMMDLGPNLGEELFGNLDDQDIPVEDDMDLFENFFGSDGFLGSPRRDSTQPDSPTGNRQAFGVSHSLKNSSILEADQDEPAQLLQQPLALAFYVSTARTGPLPKWFWANCPHLENNCPVFLKSALLIHTPFVQQNSDDLLQSNNRDCHALDSSLTTDVLRYALEGYNSLSWLVLDPATNDRLSCLPLHIQVLLQLYHSIQALT